MGVPGAPAVWEKKKTVGTPGTLLLTSSDSLRLGFLEQGKGPW